MGGDEGAGVRLRSRKKMGKATDAVTGELVTKGDLITAGMNKLQQVTQRVTGNDKPEVCTSVRKPSLRPSLARCHHGMDLTALLLLTAGLATRLYQLGRPRFVVFDELHFVKFISYYMNNMFFFDSQPPLGKQILAFGAYLCNQTANVAPPRIGTPYPDDYAVEQLRILPAVAGSLLVPSVYCLLRQLGLTRYPAALAALALLLDNSVLTQSRFLFTEPFLLLFSVAGLFCLVRSRQYNTFCLAWLIWTLLGLTLLGAATTVRYSGVMTLLLGCSILYNSFMTLACDQRVPERQVWCQLVVRFLLVLAVPLAVYVGSFGFHISHLYKSSPHDNVMSSAFRASLEGDLSVGVRDQPLVVGHGSLVTLRHTRGRICWLHSHDAPYPDMYDDLRNSSKEQQVACSSEHDDNNNLWIVKTLNTEDLRVASPFAPVRDGDMLQLVHALTGRTLAVQNFSAPLTTSHETREVSCYTGKNSTLPRDDIWRVSLVNPKDTDGVWHAITSHVRFVQQPEGYVLKYSGRPLPDWGHHRLEVLVDTLAEQDATVWNVEKHRYLTREGEDQSTVPAPPASQVPRLSFWDKFIELQQKIFYDDQEKVEGHKYASDPFDWLVMRRGVAYWINGESNAQIFLIGNPIVWMTSTTAVLTFVTLLAFYMLRRARACYDVSEDEWERLCDLGQIVLAGFAFNYLPYFTIDHTFFLHHYLPAYVFAVMCVACVIDHLFYIIRRSAYSGLLKRVVHLALLIWLGACVKAFVTFSPLTYGTTPLSADQVRALQWQNTWEMIIHKP